MGTGWRRAFCTTIPRDNNNHYNNNINNKESSPPPTSTTATGHNNTNNSKPQLVQTTSLPKLGGLFSGAGLGRRSRSTPSTPRLRCRTSVEPTPAAAVNDGGNLCVSPKLQCKTTPNTPKSSSTTKTPKPVSASNPSSPRSPFSIFKNSLRLSRNNCGVCLGSVKTGQKMAIFTGECAHSFHFPCIAGYAKKQSKLVCPVCNTVWKDVSLLAIHKLDELNQEDGNKQKSPKMTTANVKQETNIIKRQNPPPNIKHLIYNDDEPLLLSPTSSGGFVPIPEDNENAEEEDDEFKGFFVNPISSTSNETDEFSTNSISNRVALNLMPDVAIVSVSRTNETYAVVLKVKAPPPAVCNGGGELARRAPVDLVTVLDVGGSMTRAKLQMLKRAMRLVIASLGSADRLSIIAFSASAKRLLALKRMTVEGQRSARKIIDRLEISRGSCAGDALRKATMILEDRRESNPVASVMLLSDGQDESVQSGNSNQRESSNHVSSTRFAHVEIPVGSSGFGKKAGYSHESDEDAFANCVGGLLSVVVQDLRIQLGFPYGSDPGEISAVYSCNGRPTLLGSTIVRLGDLYAEEERELLLELRVPVSCVGSHLVLSARCSFKDPTTQDIVFSTDEVLLVPRPQAVRSSGPKIERLRNMFVTTRAVAESRRLIEHNELHSAQQLLASTRALLLQSSTMVLANDYIRGLEAELAEIEWRQQYQEHVEQQRMTMMQRRRVNEREVVMGGVMVDDNGEPLTPTSAWRAAERLAKFASVKRSMNKVSDLHGFENARF